ncbi:hypothetical protein QZH41_011872 [Actinostola sp. cb2023]|nr:hypothetical protein QZH41_011872 [Actinostola sp. cb2023]
MGKEQDLLNAGKTGNVSQIEKILGQRGKKSGLHRMIDLPAELLLNFFSNTMLQLTSPTIQTFKVRVSSIENYPLHLAAFSGHADVCRVLINSGPSVAKVNEQNGTEDTAMHSAAQSKSCQVVAVLLENHADPFIRNCRKESPLDLAAQYGRMENVKLLLSYHPHLLQNNVKTHSPLHLAARNGHIEVVSNLLGCGMSVNFQCDTGTALHEAALFGKLDVCTFLLQCGVPNGQGETLCGYHH